jgi:hypothetical protein
MPALHLSTFRCDVTPPLDHPLCGGWIEPVRGVDDPSSRWVPSSWVQALPWCCAPSIGAVSGTTTTSPLAFLEVGYEPTVALASPCEGKLQKSMERLLNPRPRE